MYDAISSIGEYWTSLALHVFMVNLSLEYAGGCRANIEYAIAGTSYLVRHIEISNFEIWVEYGDSCISYMVRVFFPPSTGLPRKRLALKTCKATHVHYPQVADTVFSIRNQALEDSERCLPRMS